jgi:hypothetical protein
VADVRISMSKRMGERERERVGAREPRTMGLVCRVILKQKKNEEEEMKYCHITGHEEVC